MDEPRPPACAHCGVAAPGETPPLTWSTAVENGRQVFHCERCARDHLRAIEGKLDQAWW